MMDIYQLFPSPLFSRKLSSSQYLNVLTEIKKIHRDFVNSRKVNKETVYTENSSVSLIDNKIFSSFIKEVEQISQKIFNDVLNYNDVESYVSDIWSTCLKPGEQGQVHYHSNSYLSGVWYPFDMNYSDICFYSPNNERNSLNLSANINEFNAINSSSFTFKPQKEDLILFPSYITHQVTQNIFDEPRYSLAFNIFVRGNIHANTSKIFLK